METTSLKDLLSQHVELKGLTAKKIADQTGIPERYIEMMLSGNTAKLPPAPYVHGYIAKLAEILDFDKDTMWRLYQKESPLARSGNRDRLPDNRFAAGHLSTGWLVGGSVFALIVAYFGYGAYQAFQPPFLEITTPESENSTVAQPTIILQGRTDHAYTTTLNGSELYVEKSGTFEKEFQLREGLNTLEFSAKKFLGKTSVVIRNIIYAPPPPEPEPDASAKKKSRLIQTKEPATTTDDQSTTSTSGQ